MNRIKAYCRDTKSIECALPGSEKQALCSGYFDRMKKTPYQAFIQGFVIYRERSYESESR